MQLLKTKENISHIASLRLCNSCGACQFVCPKQAIRYEETVGGYLIPRVDTDRCTECELCLSVCPGAGFGKSVLDALPEDPFTGTAIAAYVGKASDEGIFNNSQSGGLASALVCCALENKLMAGAITVAMVPGNPPRPKPHFAKSKDEILQAQKSKYCPVPLLSILDKLTGTEGPVALVGIPCQIHGIRNILSEFPKLEGKIGIVIGLFCDRIMTYSAIDYLLREAKFHDQNDANIVFRDKNIKGYPGDIHIKTANRSIALPKELRMAIKDVFTPPRCRLCFDKLNIFADISIGDPWGIENVDRERGESVAVVRTAKGKELFDQAVANGYVHVREISYSEVISGQRIDLKRMQWAGFVEAWQKMDRPLPNFCNNVSAHSDKPIESDYVGLLERALSLDSFDSRNALLHHIQWRIRISKILYRIKQPARLAKRLIKLFGQGLR